VIPFPPVSPPIVPRRRFLGALVVVFALALTAQPALARDVAALAACITDRGATYYGAYWCPVCAKQNALFGEYFSLVPYRECSDPGSRKQRHACRHVDSYPTWEFPDGTVRTGLQSLEKLAALSGCPF